METWQLIWLGVGVILCLLVELTGHADAGGWRQTYYHASVIILWPVYVPIAIWIIKQRKKK